MAFRPAAAFIGTWKGTTSCGGTATTVLTAGPTNSTVLNSGSVGSGSCYKACTITGNVNGNTVTFPATTLVDNCGNSYTMSYSGVLNGTTLTLTGTITGAINAVCTGTYTKQ